MSATTRIVVAAVAVLAIAVAGVALAMPSTAESAAPGWGAMMDDRPGAGRTMHAADGMMAGDRERMGAWHDQAHADPARMLARREAMHADGDTRQHMERGRGARAPGMAGPHCPSGATACPMR